MEWDRNNLLDIVQFINSELKYGKPMIKIEKESFGENERVIHKRLSRLGYKKINNQYILKGNITSNITNKIIKEKTKVEKNLENKVNYEKLSMLLENLDEIILLVNKNNTSNIISNASNIRSNIRDVRSFRIDTGIYNILKKVASDRNENIGEIINIALEQYLKKNL